MNDSTDQIWAYIHNELSPEKRKGFEQALNNDPLLREALDACRITHGELKNVLPLLEGENVGDDQLEKKLLAEWEATHPEYAENPARKPRRKILYFSLPLTAAAAAIIVFTLSLQTGPIHWQRTAYGTAPQLRGQSGTEPHYTRAELKQINHELREAIESHLERLAELPEPWNLKIHLQELANGTLAAEVAGHPRSNPDSSRFWNISFRNLETFRQNIPRFGRQVAEDIAGQDTQ